MVEAISYKDNTNRNTAIATGIGAIGGGTAGYMTKNILKNGEFTDEFVKQSTNKIFDVLAKDDPNRELMKDVYNLGEDPSIKQAKKFLKKWEKDIESFPGEVQELLKKSDKEILDEIKAERSALMNDASSGESLKEILDDFFTKAKALYTKNKNSFKLKANEFSECSTRELDVLAKAEKSIKGKAGLIWGAAIGTTCGVATYILSKVFNHKES